MAKVHTIDIQGEQWEIQDLPLTNIVSKWLPPAKYNTIAAINTSNFEYTIPQDGWYIINAIIARGGGSGGFAITVYLNDNQIFRTGIVGSTSSNYYSTDSINTAIPLHKNDIIRLSSSITITGYIMQGEQ